MDLAVVLLPPLLLAGIVFVSAETVAGLGQQERLPRWLHQGLMTRRPPRGVGRVVSTIVGATLMGLGLWALSEIALMAQELPIVQLAVWAQFVGAVAWLLYLGRRMSAGSPG